MPQRVGRDGVADPGQPRAADVSGRGMLQELFFDRVLVDSLN